ncbi:MAG: hypothetical protein AB2A00_28760 [Myxococcota bacterium]
MHPGTTPLPQAPPPLLLDDELVLEALVLVALAVPLVEAADDELTDAEVLVLPVPVPASS